ncbi:hypothetical protein [Neobacillus notoginsengisoli]|nr:hypothetical protein [Neobacillus notoginsengisoli]
MKRPLLNQSCCFQSLTALVACGTQLLEQPETTAISGKKLQRNSLLLSL